MIPSGLTLRTVIKTATISFGSIKQFFGSEDETPRLIQNNLRQLSDPTQAMSFLHQSIRFEIRARERCEPAKQVGNYILCVLSVVTGETLLLHVTLYRVMTLLSRLL